MLEIKQLIDYFKNRSEKSPLKAGKEIWAEAAADLEQVYNEYLKETNLIAEILSQPIFCDYGILPDENVEEVRTILEKIIKY